MNRNERIYIRLTKSEKQQLERMAASYGWDMSTYIRTMSKWVEETQPRLIVAPRAKEGVK